jgi:hypothetical protein
MCVQTKNQAWERPVEESDLPIFEKHFPGINFKGMFDAMSVNGCVPLTADLALFAGILTVETDDLGIGFVPFAGKDLRTPQTVVKLDIMEDIVDWMENTALGSYMWQEASKWAEQEYGCRVEFAMLCGCKKVSFESYENGTLIQWVRRFNESRGSLYGRTHIVWQSSIEGTDITADQFHTWVRIRNALEALPYVNSKEESLELLVASAF